MNKFEKQATLSLGAIYSFRMLGLFMILPVFSVYALRLQDATPFLVGLTLGIYGLTQACLQLPFGICSDYFGRKPIIFIGLIIFALGSLLAGLSHTIYGILFGRAIQGAGAIGSTISAFVADYIEETKRLRAMAIIGTMVALSFCLAVIIGPIINIFIGVSGIFFTTAGLACFGILILLCMKPSQIKHAHPSLLQQTHSIREILFNPLLLSLDIGVFFLHAMLTAKFMALPIILREIIALPEYKEWMLYFPVITLAFICTIPFVIIAERKKEAKKVFTGSILALAASQCFLLLHHSTLLSIGFSLFIFFTAFIILEASLPALVAKFAPINRRGTAMGIYSTWQFSGIFVGGTLGGLCYDYWQLTGVFLLSIIMTVTWFLIARRMPDPQKVSNVEVK